MKKDKKIIEKYIIERKCTNEISPIDAVFPIIWEEIQRERELFFNNPDEFYKKHPKLKENDDNNSEK